MNESITRIGAMISRYLYLHKRSLPRFLEIIFWPVMELLVWGFVSVYIQTLSNNTIPKIIPLLLSAMIFWDVLYRSQQAVSIAFVEDIWTQNIVNLFISPLKTWEWVMATFLYGFTKTVLIATILSVISLFLYHFHLLSHLQIYIIPLFLNLILFGWAVGLFTSALVIRFGHSAEALIWGVPFLIQPLSAVYYPLSVLPVWLRVISLGLPSTYVFEGIRFVINTGTLPVEDFWKSFILNLLYFVAAGVFFHIMKEKARASGRLGRLGMD